MDVRKGIFALLVDVADRTFWTDEKSGAVIHQITVKGYGLTKGFISEDPDEVSKWPQKGAEDILMRCSVEPQGKEGRFQLKRPEFEPYKQPAASAKTAASAS